jgi:hypothetical protein
VLQRERGRERGCGDEYGVDGCQEARESGGRRRLEAEKQVKQPFGEASRWREVRTLREYLLALRSATAEADIENREQLERWLRWAEEWAAGLDPLPRQLRLVAAGRGRGKPAWLIL